MYRYINPKKYTNFLTNKIISLLSPIIRTWENHYIKKYSNLSLKHQPIFIIGAPRTGSTILYQTLSNELDVLYINNLTCKFNKNIFFGFLLSSLLFKNKAHNCFKSNHGDTSKCGLNAPSECGSFWYRWLPADKHFINYDDITKNMVDEIRNEITATINYFDKPIIFKNLNAGQRLRLIQKCFPNAKFIFIKREPLFTAQSILKAKRKLHINDDEFWSVMPPNVSELEKLGAYEQIAKQIFYLEKQIVEDMTLFEDSCSLNLEYKELCKDYDSVVKSCQSFTNTTTKENYEKAEVMLTEKISLNEEEVNRFNIEINKLDWRSYNDK